METTNGDRLLAALDDAPRSSVDIIEVFSELDSTNNYLLNQAAPAGGHCRIAIANQQTEGRGRMGNAWQSPPEAGLYLSCAYTFQVVQEHFAALTLAVGVSVADALNVLGTNCKLKWPNDLVVNDGKLGGILTEVHAAKNETTTVVVGIGLNLDFSEQLDSIGSGIGRVTDLRHSLPEMPTRDDIEKMIINSTVDALIRFDTEGFKSFQARWSGLDWLADKTITVSTAESSLYGLASGIDDDGALLVSIGGQVERVLSGSVSVHAGIGASR
jgi:BirA family biotin operon repressor/biotin-[acetyl-CoA-carboxylase] ligase